METRIRASVKQFLTLLEFMESHGDLSKHQLGPHGRIRADKLWQELTNILNSIDGVCKSSDKWKKVWADWKSKTKKKALMHRRTNGQKMLTVFEERVLNVMGILVVKSQPDEDSQELNSPCQSLTPSQQDSSSAAPDSVHLDFEISFVAGNSEIQPPSPPAKPPLTLSAPIITLPPSSDRLIPKTSLSPPRILDPLESLSPPDLTKPRQARKIRLSTPPPVSTSSAPATSPSTRRRQTRAGSSPRSSVTSPHRLQRSVHRRLFEQRRLRLEEIRERNLHERESRRIEVEAERNNILNRFADIAQAWLDHYLSRDDDRL